MSSEIWKPIENYSYVVSDLGQVARQLLSRIKPLKPVLDPAGYARITLSRPDHKLNFLVHRLVLIAFRGPAPPGTSTNHINGIKSDNRLSNLEWTTLSENALHARRVLGKGVGEGNGAAKLKEEDILQIRRLLKAGFMQRVIGAKFGVTKQTIWKIATGKIWAHIPTA